MVHHFFALPLAPAVQIGGVALPVIHRPPISRANLGYESIVVVSDRSGRRDPSPSKFHSAVLRPPQVLWT